MTRREHILQGGRAGLLYGAYASILGAVLGSVRELFLAPVLGGLAAALVVGATMAVLLPLAARRILERMPPRQGWEVRAAMAAAGLALVLLAELALGAVLELSGIAGARAPRSLEERAVWPVLLVWFAVLPLLLRR